MAWYLFTASSGLLIALAVLAGFNAIVAFFRRVDGKFCFADNVVQAAGSIVAAAALLFLAGVVANFA